MIRAWADHEKKRSKSAGIQESAVRRAFFVR